MKTKQQIAGILYSHIIRIQGLRYIPKKDIPDIINELLESEPAESPVLPEITDEMIADYFNDHAKEFVNNGYTVTRCMDRDNALEMVKHFCLQSKATPQVIDKDNDDFIANDARMDM